MFQELFDDQEIVSELSTVFFGFWGKSKKRGLIQFAEKIEEPNIC